MSPVHRLAVLNTHPIQYFAPLYRRLAQEPSVELTVYYCSAIGAEDSLDQEFGERFRWDVPLLEGYRYRILPGLRKQPRTGRFFGMLNPSIFGEIRRGRYDALWLHGHNYATSWLAFLAAKLGGVPVLMRGETHLLLRRPAWKRWLRRPVLGLFYGLCAGCLPIGTRNAAFYRAMGVPESKLFLTPYSVDNAFFRAGVENARAEAQQLKQSLGIAADTPVILFASKMSARKRPFDLLRAYHRLRERGVAAALVFAGSGEESARLQSWVAEHHLANVHFAGFQNQTQIPRFFALADIFVLPSENEPWGLIINEAMCAGLPIVATEEIGAVADLVHEGENGFVYPTGDVEKLSSRLAQLCKAEALRKRMGQRSLAIIQKWSCEEAVQGILSALEALRGAASLPQTQAGTAL
jgi:glycosyltransferase involved in cell wall biosynthesis